MLLRDILRNVPHREVIGKNLNIKIEHASSDSRLLFSDSIFVAQRGSHYDGLDFVPSVKDKVSCFIVSVNEKERVRVLSKRLGDKVFVLAEDLDKTKDCLSKILFKGSGKLNIIGVTGTNGKTTVSFLIHKILSEAGWPTGLLGTVSYQWPKANFSSTLTTPDNFMLKSILHRAYKAGVKYVVLEVSSHGLATGRLKGLRLSRAIFTNLSHDHLDFHKNIGNYFKAKCRIFDYLSGSGQALLNVDDRYAESAFKRLKKKKLSFGIKKKADYKAKAYRFDKKGLEFLINIRGKDRIIRSPLLGLFNIYNILASLGCCDSLHLRLEKVIDSISRFKGPPGRLEEVGPAIFVDYAHTPHALSQSILALRQAKFEKIIVVFGCGGDRDALKRPKMGKIAQQQADYSIITSDNPRSEDPKHICAEITEGMDKNHCQVILDRKKAIKKAIALKKKTSSAVLIAGKGHENCQIFKDKTIEFSDKKVVKGLLSKGTKTQ